MHLAVRGIITRSYSWAVNYEWLFSFVTFADKLNFTHAAKELHISQPALHVQIKKLGEATGIPLYQKRGRALLLTAEGERLAAFGRSVQQQQDDVLGQLRGGIGGPVVLAAGQGAFLYLLGPAIKKFPKERWPLRLLTLRGPDAVAAVRDAKAQLGVAVVGDEPLGLETIALRSVGQVAIMQRKHPLASRRYLRPEDLHNQPLIVAPSRSPHRSMVEYSMRLAEASLSIGVEATGWQLMLAFAKDGMGIAVVNDFCPAPRGCVAIALRGMPRATYSLLCRETSNEAVLRLRELITEDRCN